MKKSMKKALTILLAGAMATSLAVSASAIAFLDEASQNEFDNMWAGSPFIPAMGSIDFDFDGDFLAIEPIDADLDFVFDGDYVGIVPIMEAPAVMDCGSVFDGDYLGIVPIDADFGFEFDGDYIGIEAIDDYIEIEPIIEIIGDIEENCEDSAFYAVADDTVWEPIDPRFEEDEGEITAVAISEDEITAVVEEIEEIVEILFTLGHVLGNDTISIDDALHILRYLVDLPSALDDCEAAFAAALIVSKEVPGIADALVILRFSAGLTSVLG